MRIRTGGILTTVAAIAVVGIPRELQAQARDTTRAPARAVKGALAFGRADSSRLASPVGDEWTVKLQQGEFVALDVVQQGIDVKVGIQSPDGSRREAVDDVRWSRGTERPRFIADAAGVWRIVVFASNNRAGPGNYGVRWTVRRVATPDDRVLIASDGLRRVAGTLSQRADHRGADSIAREVLRMRERIAGPDSLDLELALQWLTVTDYQGGRIAAADTAAARALAMRERALGTEHVEFASTLNLIGLIRWQQARYAEAEAAFRRALRVRDAYADPPDPGLASVTGNLALLLMNWGRYAEAETLYRRSVAISEANFGPDDEQTAVPLGNLARLLDLQAKYVEAEPLHRRTLTIREATLGAKHPTLARELNLTGWSLFQAGKPEEAEPLVRRSIDLWRAIDSAGIGLAAALQNLGNIYDDRGQYAEAAPLMSRALAINERVLGPNNLDVASSANDLAILYFHQGRFAEADSLYRRTLAIRERLLGVQHDLVGATLANLGLLMSQQGRYTEAEPLYRRALAINEKALGPDHPGLANDLNNLGLLFSNERRYEEAEQVITRALASSRKALGERHPQVATAMRNLAFVFLAQGRYAEAESLYRQMLTFDQRDVVAIQAASTLGELYLRQGRNAAAESLFKASVAAQEQAPDGRVDSYDLVQLARVVWRRSGDYRQALPFAERAVTVLDAASSPRARMSAFEMRARVRNAAGDTERAIADLAESIRIAEEWRPQTGGNDETRAAIFSEEDESFDLMAAWQVQRGSLQGAFDFAERGRARVLLDQLAAGSVDVRQSIPSDVRAPLEQRESNARSRMAEYEVRLTQLAARKDLAESDRAARTAVAEDSLRRAQRDFQAVYEEIKGASPLWRDLITTRGQSLSIAEMRRTLIPKGGYLLFYQIGGEQSFLFLVPSTSAARAIELKVGAQEARALRIPAGPLTSYTLDRLLGAQRGGDSTRMIDALTQNRRGGVSAARAMASEARLHALWRVLVPDEAWRRVRTAPEVVVVPGRGLHGLPFEALVVRPGANVAQVRYWLDDGPPIRYAPSATTLSNLERRAPAGRTRIAASVLSLSDPIFDAAAPVQQAGTETKTPPDVREGKRGRFTSAGVELSRLPGTAAETDAIRRAFAASVVDVTVLQGASATESALRSALAGKRYLHLATHGLVEDRLGALFAALALTPPTKASADDDGFLQLHEIYQLHLPSTELAVLSACETNVGTSIGGEGVFALSRGFMAAGARRVVASQWSVEDRSTAEVMSRFFRIIAAAERAGRSVNYTVALRNAKRAVRNNPAWSRPYYWAPFVLTGAR